MGTATLPSTEAQASTPRPPRRSPVVEGWTIEPVMRRREGPPVVVDLARLGDVERPGGGPVRCVSGARRPIVAVRRRRRALARARVGLVLLVLVIAGTVALAAAGGPVPSHDGGRETRPVASEAYLVHNGDTLWGIARRIQPEGDVRPVVDELARQMGGTVLRPGDVVVWPPTG
jgi:hypothetical protein